MVKIDTLFQTKIAKKKHTLWSGTYLYSLYKGLPPGAKNALQITSLAAYASETSNYTKVLTYTLFSYKNVLLPAQAEYSYFLWPILG